MLFPQFFVVTIASVSPVRFVRKHLHYLPLLTELHVFQLPNQKQGPKTNALVHTSDDVSRSKNISMTAVRQGDHYVVNGMKKWITNDIHSTYFATAVRTAGKPGDQYGISILLIPRGKGFSTRPLKIMGTNSAGTSYLSFDVSLTNSENWISKLTSLRCRM